MRDRIGALTVVIPGFSDTPLRAVWTRKGVLFPQAVDAPLRSRAKWGVRLPSFLEISAHGKCGYSLRSTALIRTVQRLVST
jgi:hypothetical protein